VYSVLTNCTYDGMCYDAAEAETRLAKSVDRIHFDEAWYGYARFNPMYRDRHAMRGDPATHPKDGPTVFATHSTHKLLTALSQTSFITSATAVAPSIMDASTRRIARRRVPRRCTR
jgi:arginine decarboxylase